MTEQTHGGTWQFWIDRGGTFTDLVARKPGGELISHKLLSENPEQYEDAAIQGIRTLLELSKDEPIPEAAVEAVKMGTTVATNALLERKGERTLLIVTKGFKDGLRIAYQNRPHLFTRKIELPEQLYQEVVEIDERVTADGEVLKAPDAATVEAQLSQAREAGFNACAIVFLHGYRHQAHERQVAEIARKAGFDQVSVSHEVSPLMKFVGRGDTTVVDAYLSPILRRYVDKVAGELGDVRLLFMQSNGGLTDARRFQGKDSILSGPAGGIVGSVRTAAMAGFEKVIGFDMGGTSTDVSHYAGEYERAFETQVAGVRMRAPMMQIHTVAAGGGSILHFDGSRYRVGPDSAGANPGPACYRRGGPLAVTDANVMLGRIHPDFFPRVFGPQADQPLDREAVVEKFQALSERIRNDAGDERSPEEVAEGFRRIAVENMANAIKKISIQRGYDVTEYTLNCFGGAGGQHACDIADTLGMTRIFLHPFAGVLSAYGMGLADLRTFAQQGVEGRLDEADTLAEMQDLVEKLTAQAAGDLGDQGIAAEDQEFKRELYLRYQGSDTAFGVTLKLDDLEAMRAEFEEAHRQRFSFVQPEKPLILELVSVEGIGRTGVSDDPELALSRDEGGAPEPVASAPFYRDGEWIDAGVFDRETMRPGQVIEGPAILIEPNSTTVIEEGWRAELTAKNHLIMDRHVAVRREEAVGTKVDPVMLEVFNNLFMSIAEQMGSALEKTAHSVNIKERLDFSCAVFDQEGNLVANAPHMPVHLGSMSESIRTVIRENRGEIEPGNVYVLNAPYNGGTHLPDITVVTPVFDEAGGEILFYVASRGHHADVGGITPGSMPPDSKTVEEEGVLIDNFLLIERGRFREKQLRDLLGSGKYPVRNADQNVADLQAQIAANERGVQELRKMVGHFGLDVVQAYMGHVQDNAEEQVRRVLDVLKDGSFSYEMDDGNQVAVDIAIDKKKREATIDYSRSSDQLPNNFNAPSAVCRAATLYVFRTLVEDEIPMNEGCLKPLKIVIPEGSMLNPVYPAAVVAGNVETSQVVTDTLYGALGVMAGAQGTMNNVTFGNERYQYYETLAGGSGAGPDFDGCDAVHTHMTNSRLTDPEVLEFRFPVLLESFEIRRASGGAGRHRGGDGTRRRLKFLEAMTVAILSNHRRVPPFGAEGGGPGQLGKNWVERRDGSHEAMTGTDRREMTPGDVFVVETPGGGGFGAPGGKQEDVE